MIINDLKNKNVGFVSLGCDKNRVDLERMIFNISNFGMKIVNNPKDANIIIINTCSFLESARLEAIETILEMSEFKSSSTLEKIIVTGCLNELGYKDLNESLPEVDAFINIKDNERIVEEIANLYNLSINYNNSFNRILTTPNHYAYLKISDGCNNFCSYCLIPYIRGRFKSEPIEKIFDECQTLVKKGVKEIILVAQDVTKYGIDLYGKKSLVKLIRKLSSIEGLCWIRLLYCYPEEIDDELIEEIKINDKVVKYLDIPLQHVSTKILKLMNRRSSKEGIFNLFTKLKDQIPNIVLRTTFILGFPSENDEDINEIELFLKQFKLNNVGFFKYSREEGTRSFNFDNQIDDITKDERLNKLSQIQYNIVQENNYDIIDKTLEVIVDESYDNYSIARYYGQCPQIDTIIYINKKLIVGNFYKVKLTRTYDYDFEGEVL